MTVTLLFLAALLVAEAQPVGAVRTIGLLGSRPEAFLPFEEGLREYRPAQRLIPGPAPSRPPSTTK